MAKSQQKNQENDCSLDNERLLLVLEKYNAYITEQLKKINDFDVWYETSFSQEFPKCWYSIIRTGKL